jgi:hypothetical protein
VLNRRKPRGVAAPQIGLLGIIGIENTDVSPLSGRLRLSPTTPALMCSLDGTKGGEADWSGVKNGAACEARVPSFSYSILHSTA